MYKNKTHIFSLALLLVSLPLCAMESEQEYAADSSESFDCAAFAQRAEEVLATLSDPVHKEAVPNHKIVCSAGEDKENHWEKVTVEIKTLHTCGYCLTGFTTRISKKDSDAFSKISSALQYADHIREAQQALSVDDRILTTLTYDENTSGQEAPIGMFIQL